MKYAPIIDLTVYNEILEWTNAAESFMQYGSAGKMKDVFKDKMQRVPNEEKKEWKSLGQKVDAMQALSMAIFTCRGTDASKLEALPKRKHDAKKSIKNAYQKLSGKRTEGSGAKEREIKPLYLLMEKAEAEYQSFFDKEKNYEVGCGMVAWSIKNRMVQQGYTALEETIKTYLCDQYGIDDRYEETRDGIVGYAMNEISKYMENHSVDDNIENRKNVLREIILSKEGQEEALKGKLNDAEFDMLKKLMVEVPASLIKIIKSVKEKRNDINHLGFRSNPASSDKLEADLEIYFNEFKKIIKIDDDGLAVAKSTKEDRDGQTTA